MLYDHRVDNSRTPMILPLSGQLRRCVKVGKFRAYKANLIQRHILHRDIAGQRKSMLEKEHAAGHEPVQRSRKAS